MDHKNSIDFKGLIDNKIRTLQVLEGVEIIEHHINKGIAGEKLEKIETTLGYELPPEMVNFYTAINGFQLQWRYELKTKELYGFWDVWSLERLFFGWDGKITKSNATNPFEDILWNDEYEVHEIKELKKHKVIESIEGESAYVTCKIENRKLALFYVNENSVKMLSLDFENYMQIIIDTLGIGDIRAKLAKPKFFENPLVYPDLKKLHGLIAVDFNNFPGYAG